MDKKFDAIIIGFGKGGKTLAGALGAAGRKTALIEKTPSMYGGTCINVGCIPTKFLVHKSKEAKLLNSFEEKKAFYEEAVSEKSALTGKLNEKNYLKIANAPNVTVIDGTAKFVSANEVEVVTDKGSEFLTGEKIFVNTGATPIVPEIPGIKENKKVYTSEGLLALNELPESLVIIGGGYIGVEFASIYADFGSKVTIIQDGERFLPREDAEIAEAVRMNLEKRGVRLITSAAVKAVKGAGEKAIVEVEIAGETLDIDADAVLVATGRKPNTEGLGLENADVEVTARGGIVTNEHLQSTAPNIYAMGDVVGGLQFTYISLDDFRVVKSSVLGDGSYTLEKRGVVPYSVFLDPPFSRVGMSEEEAVNKGHNVKIARLQAAAIPKAQVLQQPSGLIKAVIDADTGMILGAHLFCEESHEMINLVKLAMDAGLRYEVLRDMIFTHPTMSEAFNDLFAI